MKEINATAHLLWGLGLLFAGMTINDQQEQLDCIHDRINTIQLADSLNIEKQAKFNKITTMVLSTDEFPIKKKERLRELNLMSWGVNWGEK